MNNHKEAADTWSPLTPGDTDIRNGNCAGRHKHYMQITRVCTHKQIKGPIYTQISLFRAEHILASRTQNCQFRNCIIFHHLAHLPHHTTHTHTTLESTEGYAMVWHGMAGRGVT